MNQNGKKIDYDGPQCKNLLRTGYRVSEDESKLEYGEDFNGVRTHKKGRPKKVLKKLDLIVVQKRQNPVTKKYIKNNGGTFKNLSKKYVYDPIKNKLLKFVKHPKKAGVNLDVSGTKVKKPKDQG